MLYKVIKKILYKELGNGITAPGSLYLRRINTDGEQQCGQEVSFFQI